MAYKIEVPWPELKLLFRYINDIMGCACFPDLLELKLFPNAKEITESCAVHRALRYKVRHFDLRDPEVTFIAVGDGNTPRTGALMAFRSKWNCISIDPRLKQVSWPSIERLACWRDKVEDCGPIHVGKLVIAAVHSHAPLDVACEKFTADERIVIAMPCCKKQVRERPPDIRYVDKGIWSPMNEMLIWKDF